MVRGRGGYTLVEVVIATLLMAIMTVPIMSLAMTSKLSAGRFERRHAAGAAVRRLAETLKGYVTADRAVTRGPGSGSDGWALPGDSRSYAFDPDWHELQVAEWAPALAPYEGRIRYRVDSRATPSGDMPDVTFEVTWKEPEK